MDVVDNYKFKYALNIPGWMSEQEMKIINNLSIQIKLFHKINIQNLYKDCKYKYTINSRIPILEIGSFCGRSAKVWCINNKIICIDPFNNTIGNFPEGAVESLDGDKTFIKNNLNKSLYTIFLNNIISELNIYHIRDKSYNIINYKNLFPSTIFIDGDHSENGIKTDLNLSLYYMEKYKEIFGYTKGFFICGHDYGHTHSAMSHFTPAIDKFVKDNNLIFYHYYNTMLYAIFFDEYTYDFIINDRKYAY